MTKPKILVTAAAGRTGSATVLQLLDKGFPVRAFVRRRDARAEALERAGAELAFGNLFDYRDVRQALVGVQRAYHCPPHAPNFLEGAAVFALAAEDAKLEVVALMSQWNPHAADPSIASCGHWIANQLYRWMPTVDVIHVNPGLFAFMYLLGLPAIVHMGVLMGPFGEGQNAPPSNEDIARVAAGVIADPGPHIGKSYRPTGAVGHRDAASRQSRRHPRGLRHRGSGRARRSHPRRRRAPQRARGHWLDATDDSGSAGVDAAIGTRRARASTRSICHHTP